MGIKYILKYLFPIGLIVLIASFIAAAAKVEKSTSNAMSSSFSIEGKPQAKEEKNINPLNKNQIEHNQQESASDKTENSQAEQKRNNTSDKEGKIPDKPKNKDIRETNEAKIEDLESIFKSAAGNTEKSNNYSEAKLSEAELPAITVSEKEIKQVSVPGSVGKVIITNPGVITVYAFDKKVLRVYGKKAGSTSVVVISENAKESYKFDVDVKHNTKEIQKIIESLYPAETMTLKSIPGGLILGGSVSSAQVVKDINEVLTNYLGSGEKIINQVKLDQSNQISLQVKIAEVKRDALNSFGVRWLAQKTSGKLRWGILRGTSPVNDANGFSASDDATSPGTAAARFVNNYFDISTALDMLEEENMASVLAEPTLVTLPNEEASFLAGGEFPYPVAQGNGGLSNTIEFKPYGVGLSFVATEVGDRIRLQVKTEVSDIENASQSSTPGIKTRRASTSVELNNGESLVIAGLLHETSSNGISSFPGLGDLPILGALFRSTNFQNQKTELVVAVTVHSVNPVSSAHKVLKPNDNMRMANQPSRVLGKYLAEPRTPNSYAREAGFSY